MIKKGFYLCLAIAIFFLGLYSCKRKSSDKNQYGLDVIQNIERYESLIEKNPDNVLIDLKTFIPGIVLDIRYATTNNFTGQQIYNSPRAFARKPVAEALKNIQTQLNEKGLGLKIFDAYRPYAATVKFYEVYPDTNFVAAPWNGSRHNRGCAVDVTLVDLASGKQLSMPTPFDDFTEKAAADYTQLSDSIIANRQLLSKVMKENGFAIYPYEWWHFDYTGWEHYNLLDLSFEELEKFKD
jgi:D-alanyl-D-alanine dipeptidase